MVQFNFSERTIKAKVVYYGPAQSGKTTNLEQVHVLTADSAVVAYRAQARRGDMDYDALFTSTYVRAGEHWKLTVHQQTPL